MKLMLENSDKKFTLLSAFSDVLIQKWFLQFYGRSILKYYQKQIFLLNRSKKFLIMTGKLSL